MSFLLILLRRVDGELTTVRDRIWKSRSPDRSMLELGCSDACSRSLGHDEGCLRLVAVKSICLCSFGLISVAVLGVRSAMPQEQISSRDVRALFAEAESEKRIGLARKSRLVDARPAKNGEVVITVIAGEGEETRSKPAEVGDFVVRNRCQETGNEQYLVKAAKFAERYEGPLSEPDAEGWEAFRPRGRTMRYFIVGGEEGTFHFTAPWGEQMIARPGDAIVQDANDSSDTYRVAAVSFECSYEIIQAP